LSFVVHTGPTKGTDKYNQFVTDFEAYGFDYNYVVAVVTDTTGNMNTFGAKLSEGRTQCHPFVLCRP
jgi:hypothetical protein